MQKTILIAGKDFPEGKDFADSMVQAGYAVVVTGSSDTEKDSRKQGGIVTAAWNRPSSVSARTLVLKAENAFGTVTETVLYFDASSYASQFTVFSQEECTKAADIMIAGYQHLAMEMIARFEQRKTDGKLIFLLKRHPSMEAVLRSSSLRGNTAVPSGPFVSAAQAAFAAFAEDAAVLAAKKENVTVVLVSCDEQNETAANDRTLASWLAGYLDTLDSLKTKTGSRQSADWVKAGSRGPGFLSRFHS